MDERKRGMMRGEMWGDSDEQAIMMIDTAVEVRAMEEVAGRIEIKRRQGTWKTGTWRGEDNMRKGR